MSHLPRAPYVVDEQAVVGDSGSLFDKRSQSEIRSAVVLLKTHCKTTSLSLLPGAELCGSDCCHESVTHATT